ncbi:MAG TPA: DNA-3-methyladenine glycosylase [Pirellulales bacterium]|jgi:DNA-3-methyladenine glycosylase|nr:DNA-3-methyladenine glycosylase [Pirellulales bacterium]
MAVKKEDGRAKLRKANGDTRAAAALDADFFARDTLTVARELIGTTMIVGRCRCRIVETEAYTTDAASHTVTRRHKATMMRETFAHLYVYKIYGVHYCLNFTTERDGVGAVLIRAAEPLTGTGQMARRRGTDDLKRLLNGPGRLCQALAIDATWTGRPLGRGLRLLAAPAVPSIVAGPRIGISRATELEWRFFERDSPFVSRGPGTAGNRQKRTRSPPEP